MSPRPHILAILQSFSAPETIVVGIVALLIFWRRPLEVGRSFDTAEQDWSAYAMAAVVVLFLLLIVAAMLA